MKSVGKEYDLYLYRSYSPSKYNMISISREYDLRGNRSYSISLLIKFSIFAGSSRVIGFREGIVVEEVK